MAIGKMDPDGISLKDLLDGVCSAHHSDIKDIVWGHLNEKKVWNPEAKIRAPWRSATVPGTMGNKGASKSRRLDVSPNRGKRYPSANKGTDDKLRGGVSDSLPSELNDSLCNFMLGTAGNLPKVGNIESDNVGSPSDITNNLDRHNGYPSDGTLTQELVLPELMLPALKTKDSGTAQAAPFSPQYDFLRMNIVLPSKGNQYKERLNLQKNLLEWPGKRKSFGVRDTECGRLEKDLQKRLNFHEKRHRHMKQPNFYRLQAFDDCWNQVIEQSALPLALELRSIKESYDKYITKLLDARVSTGDLYKKIQSLPAETKETGELVQQEDSKLRNLTQEAKYQLEENKRLKSELKRLVETDANVKGNSYRASPGKTRSVSTPPVKHLDFEDKTSHLHAEIKRKHDEINSIISERRTMVTLSACDSLEHDNKEMEVSIQKLCKQNDFLEKAIEKAEAELEELLERNQSTERDRRSLWKKINTTMLSEKVGKNTSATPH